VHCLSFATLNSWTDCTSNNQVQLRRQSIVVMLGLHWRDVGRRRSGQPIGEIRATTDSRTGQAPGPLIM